MNILIVTSSFPSDKNDNAQAPFALDLIELLLKDKHSITVITHARGENHEQVSNSFETEWFPWRRTPGRLAELNLSPRHIISMLSLFWNGMRSIRKISGSKNIDLAICLWVIPSGLYLYLNHLAGMNTPYVLWALGSDINKYKGNPIFRNLLKKIIRRAEAIFADGFELARTVKIISGRECQFLPTFRLLSGSDRSRTNTPKKTITFLFVGRHAPVKGVDVLIEAILILGNTKNISFRCIIVGDGELTNEMKLKIEEAQLQNKVTFPGRISDNELFTQYKQADCVVIPSRSESIPLVLSEAVQMNLPLIVSRVGDMGELTEKYDLGMVVEPNNPEMLAQAMINFMHKPRKISAISRRKLLDTLMMENAFYRLKKIIQEIEHKKK